MRLRTILQSNNESERGKPESAHLSGIASVAIAVVHDAKPRAFGAQLVRRAIKNVSRLTPVSFAIAVINASEFSEAGAGASHF
jgi:hypothetical protein